MVWYGMVWHGMTWLWYGMVWYSNDCIDIRGVQEQGHCTISEQLVYNYMSGDWTKNTKDATMGAIH